MPPRVFITQPVAPSAIDRATDPAKKKAIAAKKDGRRFLYRPLLKRADYIQQESQGLLDRLFDGKLAPLVTHFSERKKLSPQDIADLKRLVAELDDGK